MNILQKPEHPFEFDAELLFKNIHNEKPNEILNTSKTPINIDWFLSLIDVKWGSTITEVYHNMQKRRGNGSNGCRCCCTCSGKAEPSCCLCGDYGGPLKHSPTNRPMTVDDLILEDSNTNNSRMLYPNNYTQECQTVTSTEVQTRQKKRNRKNQTSDDPVCTGGCDDVLNELREKVRWLEENAQTRKGGCCFKNKSKPPKKKKNKEAILVDTNDGDVQKVEVREKKKDKKEKKKKEKKEKKEKPKKEKPEKKPPKEKKKKDGGFCCFKSKKEPKRVDRHTSAHEVKSDECEPSRARIEDSETSKKKCTCCGNECCGVTNNNTIVLPQGLADLLSKTEPDGLSRTGMDTNNTALLSMELAQQKREMESLRMLVQKYVSLAEYPKVKSVTLCPSKNGQQSFLECPGMKMTGPCPKHLNQSPSEYQSSRMVVPNASTRSVSPRTNASTTSRISRQSYVQTHFVEVSTNFSTHKQAHDACSATSTDTRSSSWQKSKPSISTVCADDLSPDNSQLALSSSSDGMSNTKKHKTGLFCGLFSRKKRKTKKHKT